MDLTIITVVLSSAVVSTIVSFICGLFTTHKKDYIENITHERKQWREELREIAGDISTCANKDELLIEIAKLKVRINAYGIKSNHIMHDRIMWILIKDIETNYVDDELENYKINLIDLISCLLKYDWERSKSEITGNVHIRVLIAVQVIVFIIYSIYAFSQKITITYYMYCFMYASVYLGFSVWYVNQKLSKRRTIIIGISVTFSAILLLYFRYDATFMWLMTMPMVVLVFAAYERYKIRNKNERLFIEAVKEIYPFTEMQQ